jgi:DNA/RNA-binding domain of Phe-tRNA-synthetase-like protein
VSDISSLRDHLDLASIDDDVLTLRPDYRVILIAASGIQPSPSDDHSEELLLRAELSARSMLAEHPAEEHPRIASWRAAYRAFGAKPQRTRNSLEALVRRADSGLPRVNKLTDLYNAVSVRHMVPIGGEDLDRYEGPARLSRADGSETFETTAAGLTQIEHPEKGEVVWRDDHGVTCRRWNWRQTVRTQLTEQTSAALFILDALDPMTDQELDDAAAELITELQRLGPDVTIARRTLPA